MTVTAGAAPRYGADVGGPGLRRRVVQIAGSPGVDQVDEAVVNALDMAPFGFDTAALIGVGPPGPSGPDGPYGGLAPGRVLVAPHLGSANPRRSSTAAFSWLVQWLAVVRPDLVHAHGHAVAPVALAAAQVVGLPAVVTVHRGLDRAGFLERLLLRRAEAVIVSGSKDHALARLRSGGDTWRCPLVPLGLELADRERAEVERRRARRVLGDAHRLVIGVDASTSRPGPAGRRPGEPSGLEAVVGAFVLVAPPDARLVLLAPPWRASELRSLHRSLGTPASVRVETDLAPERAVAGCDRLVVVDRLEGLTPMAVRAAAHGIPLLALDAGNVADLVAVRGRGLLVARDSIDGWADAFARLPAPLDRPADGPTGYNAEVVERHSIEAMRRRLARVWRDVLEPVPEVASVAKQPVTGPDRAP